MLTFVGIGSLSLCILIPRTLLLSIEMGLRRWLAKKKKHRLLKQIIPQDELDGSISMSSSKVELPSTSRPAFSLPVMANNFRSFNAR